MRHQLPYSIVVCVAVALASCGTSESDDDVEDDGEGGAVERGGAGPSGGSGGSGAGGGGSGGAPAGSGGMDPCAPLTCMGSEDCTPVTPETALITDFSMQSDTNVVFHSESKEWWLEFFGGPYVYPAFDQCSATQPEPRLEQELDGETWHITGTVATYAGAGLWFAPCNVDMSAYSGISFTISGSVGPTGSILVNVGTAGNSPPSTDPLRPSCHPNQNRCVPANPEMPWLSCANNVVTVSGINETPRTVTIPWEDLTLGMPETTTNSAEIRGIGFSLDWEFAYTADDAYPVDFTIDDVQLVE